MEQTSAPYFPVVIVGGGQAGLSVSYYLQQRNVEHLVFEENVAFHAWREKRWDSFCLVTPNWQCRLPGFPYRGDDPEGFMKREQIIQYLEGFLAELKPPILEHVKVTRLKRNRAGEFELETSRGRYRAGQVVIASGNYHTPKIPRMAEKLPAGIDQLHTSEYRNPEQLRQGAVLVVGTGQSGCQIAEDLHLVGRQVHLCVGSAPRVARRYRGRDVVAWLDEMGHYSLPVTEHPLQEGVRAKANHYVTGRDGGRDIDLRVFAQGGMALHGRLLDIVGTELRFGDDLQKNLDGADSTRENINRAIDKYIAERGLDAPSEAPYVAPWQPERPLATLDLVEAGITTILWSMGYQSAYDWVELPTFDGKGLPIHQRGVSPVDGLFFMGLPWLHTWGSGRFSGVARDAEYVVQQMVDGQREQLAV
ncbi:MAG: czcO 2 [Myxococcaceae bacterium]|nr:czcO 2 [Myxococcaceae bacterium]